MANVVVTNTKKWWESKTIWANVFAGSLGMLGIVDAQFLHTIGITDTTKYLGIIGAATTALNVMLRVLGTNKPISSQNQATVGFIDKTGDDANGDGTINYVAEINACQTIDELNELHPQIPPEFESVWQFRLIQISNGNGGTPK